MDRYIPPDARDLAADTDFEALAAQDPVWVPPPPHMIHLADPMERRAPVRPPVHTDEVSVGSEDDGE